MNNLTHEMICNLKAENEKLKEIVNGRTGKPEKNGKYWVKLNWTSFSGEKCAPDYREGMWENGKWLFWLGGADWYEWKTEERAKIERWWEIPGNEYEKI